MVLVIEVSTIIHDMPICLWRTMDLWIVGKHVQLDFLESNHLVMALAKRLLWIGRQQSLKFLISIIVAHLESGQGGVLLDLLTFCQIDWNEYRSLCKGEESCTRDGRVEEMGS